MNHCLNKNSSNGAVLVELTYIIIILLFLSLGTLEIVSFLRHKKVALMLSTEAASIVYKECPDIARNRMEKSAFNKLVGETDLNKDLFGYGINGADLPNNNNVVASDCLSRNLNNLALFADSFASIQPADVVSTGAKRVYPASILIRIYNGTANTMTTLAIKKEFISHAKTIVDNYVAPDLNNDADLSALINTDSTVVIAEAYLPYNTFFMIPLLAKMFNLKDFLINECVKSVSII